MKIVIADDELDSCFLLKFHLNKVHIPFKKIFMVYNGEDFIKIFKEELPDFCFVDIKMPIFSGFEAIEEIRQTETGKDSSLYILSGYEEFEFARKAIRLGILDYLLKPIQPIQIKEIVDFEIQRAYPGIDIADIDEQIHTEKEVNRVCSELKKIEEFFHAGDFFNCMESLEKWYKIASILKIRLDSQYLEQVFQIIDDCHTLESQYRKLLNTAQHKSEVNGSKNSKGKSIVDFICCNLNNCDLNLEYLSDRFHVSPNYLGLLLKNEVGSKFNVFLTALRIDKAKNYLEKTDMKIKEISRQCGFSNTSYFIRIFRAQTGTTPINYRKEHQRE